MDPQYKKKLIGENKYICKYGILQNLPLYKSTKTHFDENFIIPDVINFCDVFIKSAHSIVLAKEYTQNKYKPVIIMLVNPEFDGTNLETNKNILDDYINVRTNYLKTVIPEILPLKDSEVIYTQCCYTIRNELFNFMNINDMYNFAIITSSVITSPELIEETCNLDDYLKLKEKIETIFQTAIHGGHDVLILNDFACKTNNIPIQDICDIYNFCILKYGSQFKIITICIPIIDSNDVINYNFLNKEIIKPQDIPLEDEISDSHNNELFLSKQEGYTHKTT
jgi:hypothetical protein